MDVYKTEEEQVESIKAWWKENARALLIGVSIALASVFSWQGWQQQQQKHAEEASDLFQQLIIEEKAEKTTQLADQIIADYADTPYAALASFQKAKQQLNAGNRKLAITTLENIAQLTDSSSIKNIAQIRALRIRLGNGDAKAVILEIDQYEPSNFSGQYEELKGDAYLSLGDIEKARFSYISALSGAASEKRFIQQKLDNLGPAELIDVEEKAVE